MADWKDTLKKAWEDYGADVLAGGAGAVGGWFLPHLFWDKPSYVNKGASAALLAAISIVGLRGIKDALKKIPEATTLLKAKAVWAALTGGPEPDDTAPKGTQEYYNNTKNVLNTYTPGKVAGGAALGTVTGHTVGVVGNALRDPINSVKLIRALGLRVRPTNKNYGWRHGHKARVIGGGAGAVVWPLIALPVTNFLNKLITSQKPPNYNVPASINNIWL